MENGRYVHVEIYDLTGRSKHGKINETLQTMWENYIYIYMGIMSKILTTPTYVQLFFAYINSISNRFLYIYIVFCDLIPKHFAISFQGWPFWNWNVSGRRRQHHRPHHQHLRHRHRRDWRWLPGSSRQRKRAPWKLIAWESKGPTPPMPRLPPGNSRAKKKGLLTTIVP